MLEMGINDLWIGANDIHREGTMVWVSDKTNVSKGFSNWHPGEPNNSRSSEHCVLLVLKFTASDYLFGIF
jgi:hypothetical protein